MKNRINYEAIDSQPQKELDDLVFLARYLFKTPISLISILEKDRQIFQSKIGLDLDGSLKQDSFCHHTLENPDKPLVVTDALNDLRFKDSKLVVGYPNIRFYAGIPLKNSKNEVFGTFCIIDCKPRELSEDELRCMEILSRKAMFHLNSRAIISTQKKVLSESSKRILNLEKVETFLKQMTNKSFYENALFELNFSQNSNAFKINFISEGVTKLYPHLDTNKDEISIPAILSKVSANNRFSLMRSFLKSLDSEREQKLEYLEKLENGKDVWYRFIFSTERKTSDLWLIHGIIKNITHEKEHQEALRRILFDISHVIRRPLTTIIGLTELLKSEKELSLEDQLELVKLVGFAANELEEYTVDMNSEYQDKIDSLSSLN